MRKYLLLLTSVIIFPCYAAYTGNHVSKIGWVKIYNNDTIYFGLEVMPADHGCADNFFGLVSTLTDKQRDRYYSMLLAARASGKKVTVGYDKINPDCRNNRPVAHALSF